MKGASYYRARGRKRKEIANRQKRKQADNILVLMLYLIFFPIIGLVNLLGGKLDENRKAKKVEHINIKYYQPQNSRVKQKRTLDYGYAWYPIKNQESDKYLDYVFFSNSIQNEENYDSKLYRNDKVLVHLMNTMEFKELMTIDGVCSRIASHVIVHRPYKSFKEVLEKPNGFDEVMLEAFVKRLDKDGKRFIELKETDNRAKNATVTYETTTFSVKLMWDEIEEVLVKRDGTVIATVNNGTSFTDEPLLANKEYTYVIYFTDEYLNQSSKLLKIRTNEDAYGFDGLAPGVFVKDSKQTHKGDFLLNWKGNLDGKTLQMQYQYRKKYQPKRFTNSYLYFKDEYYDGLDVVVIKGDPEGKKINDVQSINMTVPDGAVSLLSTDRDLEIINISVLGKSNTID